MQPRPLPTVETNPIASSDDDTSNHRNHELKTWPEFFQAILDGRKKHEIRQADRPFAVGDTLHLREWDPETHIYSGRDLKVTVTYITPGGQWGVAPDMCVMSIVPVLE